MLKINLSSNNIINFNNRSFRTNNLKVLIIGRSQNVTGLKSIERCGAFVCIGVGKGFLVSSVEIQANDFQVIVLIDVRVGADWSTWQAKILDGTTWCSVESINVIEFADVVNTNSCICGSIWNFFHLPDISEVS